MTPHLKTAEHILKTLYPTLKDNKLLYLAAQHLRQAITPMDHQLLQAQTKLNTILDDYKTSALVFPRTNKLVLCQADLKLTVLDHDELLNTLEDIKTKLWTH